MRYMYINISGELDIERKLFLQYCRLQESLVNTYNKIHSIAGDKTVVGLDKEVNCLS